MKFKMTKDALSSLKEYLIRAIKKQNHYTHLQALDDVSFEVKQGDMSAITGSLYRGIVNAHIHNSLKVYSQEYELSYIYGGLFVLGYCRWIHEYVRTHQIDKILFLARDDYAKFY